MLLYQRVNSQKPEPGSCTLQLEVFLIDVHPMFLDQEVELPGQALCGRDGGTMQQ